MNLNKIFLQIILAAATLSTILAGPDDYKKVIVYNNRYNTSWVSYGNLLAAYKKNPIDSTVEIFSPTSKFYSDQQPNKGILAPIGKKTFKYKDKLSDDVVQKGAFELFESALKNQPWLADKFEPNGNPTFVSDSGYFDKDFDDLNNKTNQLKTEFATQLKVNEIMNELRSPNPTKTSTQLKKMIEQLPEDSKTEISESLGNEYLEDYKTRYQAHQKSLVPPVPAPAQLVPPTQQDPAPLAPPIQQEPAPAPTPVTEVPKIDNPAPAPLAPPTNVDPIPAPTTNIDPNPTPNGGNGGGGNNGGDLFGTLCKGTVVVAVLYFVARLAQSGIQKKTASKNEPKPVGKKNNIIEEE